MTKKERLLGKIVELLKEKGATETNKLRHDIYLLNRGIRDSYLAWYGKIETLWLGSDGTPMCYIWRWGVGFDEEVSTLTYTNLKFVHEYLVKGYVVQ